MWGYVIFLYLPFTIMMILWHDTAQLPICLIGWNTGGIQYLILYIALTIPFILYLLFTFNKKFIGNKKSIKILSIISSCLVIIGSFIPTVQTNRTILLIHEIITVSSSIILILTILTSLIIYALGQKLRWLLLSFYALYTVALLLGFYILYTAALFQLLVSISFFIILITLKTTSLFSKASRSGNEELQSQ